MASEAETTGASGARTIAFLAFLLSLVSALFVLQFFSTHAKLTRKRNRAVRARLFRLLGLSGSAANDEDGVKAKRRTVIGFFHPYCNAGGGGERVLWQAIEHHLRQDPRAVIVVYSGDVGLENRLDEVDEASVRRRQYEDRRRLRAGREIQVASKEEILNKCHQRFGIPLHSPDLASRIHFLPLTTRHLVSDGYWKRLTLLGQAYGSARIGFEACSQLLPDVFIDTMGYAFSYPIVRMFNHRIAIGGYVHYPMISTDMLQRVRERRAGHTNDASVSGSRWRSQAKLIYYHFFAWIYAAALRSSDALVANGSWTRDHLNTLIVGKKRRPHAKYVHVVYPPCDTASLTTFDVGGRDRFRIVSLAQFRPEKEHAVQIRIIKEVVERRKQAGISLDGLKLVCMGSCRNDDDESRIEKLKRLAASLGVETHVSFVVNAPYSTVLENLKTASIGLSTMVDEHFGINVVEFMAAGLITLSHASAGPLLDIAVPVDGKPCGFHAKSVSDFADELDKIFSLASDKERAIRVRARGRAMDTFSNEAFCHAWEALLWKPLVEPESRKSK